MDMNLPAAASLCSAINVISDNDFCSSESDDGRRRRKRDHLRDDRKMKDKERGHHHERKKRELQTTERQINKREEIGTNVKKIAKAATKQERYSICRKL